MRWESGSGHHAGDPDGKGAERSPGGGGRGGEGEGEEDLFLISVYDKAGPTTMADEAVCRQFIGT
jgi:hypothetical protein